MVQIYLIIFNNIAINTKETMKNFKFYSTGQEVEHLHIGLAGTGPTAKPVDIKSMVFKKFV